MNPKTEIAFAVYYALLLIESITEQAHAFGHIAPFLSSRKFYRQHKTKQVNENAPKSVGRLLIHRRPLSITASEQSTESSYPLDYFENPYDLIIDTRINHLPPIENGGETKVSSECVVYVDGQQLSDFLLEVFGAQSVVTTKSRYTATESPIESDDIFGEPDVDYSKDIAVEMERMKDNPLSAVVSQSHDIYNSGVDVVANLSGRKVWNNAVIVARMPPTSETFLDPDSIIASLEELMEIRPGSLSYRTEAAKLEDQTVDWCAEVQKGWAPSLIGADVVAALPFHTEEDCMKVVVGSKPFDTIVLEGGSAFGTGDHPTTSMCGDWLLDVCSWPCASSGSVEPLNVMDYGAGSGILALVALLAAKRQGKLDLINVEGVEVDPAALASARTNSIMNGYQVPDQIEFYAPMRGAPGAELWGDLAGASPGSGTTLPLDRIGTYDIVVANILAQPLISLAKTLALLTKKGTGHIGLSGLMVDQADMVIKAYRPFFDEMKVTRQNRGWVLLEGRRNNQEVMVDKK